MSRRYKTDEEKRGYESYSRPGYSRYDGGYEYEQGWDEHARDERNERERREDERAQIEAEERAAERRAHERAMERQQEEEYWQPQQPEQPEPEPEPDQDNYEYLVPYSTALLPYSTFWIRARITISIMVTLYCKESLTCG